MLLYNFGSKTCESTGVELVLVFRGPVEVCGIKYDMPVGTTVALLGLLLPLIREEVAEAVKFKM